MNERIARQIEEMKKQTIGVEVEMNNIRRDKAAELAAAFFGTGRFENTASRNGYYTWSAWDESGREWKFQKDVSIAGPDDKKCELVTPILTYSDIETLQELIRKLRHAGAKSDATRGCGVHIHIGAKGHTPQTLRNLANIMAGHENLLADALDLDRGRMNRYCRTVDPRFLKELNKKKPKTMENMLSTVVHSFTKDRDYTVCISNNFLTPEDHILFIDDFLAYGNAAMGMVELAEQSGAVIEGMGFIIEKAFQDGGNLLREKGIRVESLAIIDNLDDCKITVR